MTEINRKIFKDLYAARRKFVFRNLMRFTRDPDLSDDLIQEVFYNIYRSTNTFDESRTAHSPWIYRITLNTYYKYYLRNRFKKTDFVDTNILSNVSTSNGNHELDDTSKILHDSILKIIDELPEPERTIIILKKLKGLTFKVTSKEPGLSDRTIQRRLLKALELIRVKLKETGIEFNNE